MMNLLYSKVSPRAIPASKRLLPIFPSTEERRKEVSKDVKKKGDNAKVALRNIRRDANEAFKKAEKAGDISEDDLTEMTEKMQKLTDKMVEKVDKAVEEKTKEIMTV